MHDINEPFIEERSEQVYVGISAKLSSSLEGVPELTSQVLAFLQRHGESPAGRAFLRFWCFDDDGNRQVEVGIPTKRLLPEEAGFVSGYLPGGDFARAEHTGPQDEVWQAADWLVQWMEREGLSPSLRYEGETKIWDGCFAFFVTNPIGEVEQGKWRAELCILLLGDRAA